MTFLDGYPPRSPTLQFAAFSARNRLVTTAERKPDWRTRACSAPGTPRPPDSAMAAAAWCCRQPAGAAADDRPALVAPCAWRELARHPGGLGDTQYHQQGRSSGGAGFP
ncbi:hypothetical protein ACU4GD_07785 [Cupriavidus basilensis]